jgi:anti-sigma B factor antagonist
VAISCEDLGEDIRRIILSGRLDIQGTEDISAQFKEFSTTARHRIVVDLSAVSFLASIGIRALISNAKSLHKLGGRMVLVVGDNASIYKTLEVTGIEVLLPMYKEFDEAKKALCG